MAEVGKVVTGWVKYMGTIPDKIVLLVRGEAMRDLRRYGCGGDIHNVGYEDKINEGNIIRMQYPLKMGFGAEGGINCWSSTVFPTWGGPWMTGGRTLGRSRRTERRGSPRHRGRQDYRPIRHQRHGGQRWIDRRE